MHRFTLRQLEYLVSCIDHGSIAAAAEAEAGDDVDVADVEVDADAEAAEAEAGDDVLASDGGEPSGEG